jgi:hypothetical protein
LAAGGKSAGEDDSDSESDEEETSGKKGKKKGAQAKKPEPQIIFQVNNISFGVPLRLSGE